MHRDDASLTTPTRIGESLRKTLRALLDGGRIAVAGENGPRPNSELILGHRNLCNGLPQPRDRSARRLATSPRRGAVCAEHRPAEVSIAAGKLSGVSGPASDHAPCMRHESPANPINPREFQERRGGTPNGKHSGQEHEADRPHPARSQPRASARQALPTRAGRRSRRREICPDLVEELLEFERQAELLKSDA